MKLLCGFYRATKGKIFLESNDIGNVKMSSWYKSLGVLFQDFNTNEALTLKENIILGNSEIPADEKRMKIAAEKANLNFVSGY